MTGYVCVGGVCMYADVGAPIHIHGCWSMYIYVARVHTRVLHKYAWV